MKKPDEPTFPDAPAHLSARAKELWINLGPTIAETASRQFLLEQLLEATDRAAEYREAIAKNGLLTTTKSSGVKHVHPLARLETESRAQIAKFAALLAMEEPRTLLEAILRDI